MEYGLTGKRVWQLFLLSLAGGVLIATFVLARVLWEGHTPRWEGIVLAFLVLPGFILLVSVAGCAVKVRVGDDAVEQVLWRRFVLARQPLTSLVAIENGDGFSAAVFCFSNGVRMPLVMFYKDVEAMRQEVKNRCRWIAESSPF